MIAGFDQAVITPVEQFVRPRPLIERPSSPNAPAGIGEVHFTV